MEERTGKKVKSKVNIVRRIAQAVFLGLFIYFFIQASYTSVATPPSNLFLRFDPLSGIFSLTASRNIDAFLRFWPAWIILGLTLFGRRFFCGWICPLGTCFDAAEALKPKQLKYYKPSGKEVKEELAFTNQPFSRGLLARGGKARAEGPRLKDGGGGGKARAESPRLKDGGAGGHAWAESPRLKVLRRIRIKYILLLLVIGLSFAGINLLFISSPLVIMNRTLYTLSIAQIPVTFIILILIAYIYRPRFWCEELCPLGALFSLTSMASNWLGARFKTLSIVKNPENCVLCGACWRECLFGVSEPLTKTDNGILRSADCTACGACVKACPADNALELKTMGLTLARSHGRAKPLAHPAAGSHVTDDGQARLSKLAVSRREFVASLGIGTVMLAGYGVGLRNYTDPVLRMPGAQNEEEFLAKCARCAECMMVCPTNCIKPMGIDDGFQKLWTPRFKPRDAACTFDQCDQACAKACPYGAIKSEAPEDVKIGIAHINRQKCRAYNGRICLICKERCRFDAIDVDDKLRPIVKTANCTGCGACQVACPTTPESIAVFPIGVEPSWPSGGGGGGGGRRG